MFHFRLESTKASILKR